MFRPVLLVSAAPDKAQAPTFFDPIDRHAVHPEGPVEDVLQSDVLVPALTAV
jgi:hypothetical protein